MEVVRVLEFPRNWIKPV